jgi:predicted ATPase
VIDSSGRIGRLVLLCGLPGSGKTTLARRRGRAALSGRTFDQLCQRVIARNATSQWRDAPMTREHMASWLPLFEAPDAAEMALFDSPAIR